MPPRPLRDRPADALAEVYADAYRRLRALEDRLFDPAVWRRAARVRALQARILAEVDRLDRRSSAWVRYQLRDIWRAGGDEFARLLADSDVAARFGWTMLHREGLRAIQADTLNYVLAANAHIDRRARTAVRRIVRDETVRKITDGRTARQEGKLIAQRLRDELGMTRIPDRAGRLIRVDVYGETVARTQSAIAYNRAAITQAVQERVRWLEIFDGAGCGLSAHGLGADANGMIVDVETAAQFPLAHPRCQRAFSPRPDLGLARSRDGLAEDVERGAARGALPAVRGAGRRGQAARREQVLAGRRNARNP